jgi:hypothetical protein
MTALGSTLSKREGSRCFLVHDEGGEVEIVDGNVPLAPLSGLLSSQSKDRSTTTSVVVTSFDDPGEDSLWWFEKGQRVYMVHHADAGWEVWVNDFLVGRGWGVGMEPEMPSSIKETVIYTVKDAKNFGNYSTITLQDS